MIDGVFWKVEVCDLCRKDESKLQPKLIGIMEDGRWVGGFTKEKSEKAKEIRWKWEEEISCPCIHFYADCDEVVICEKHLFQILARRDDELG